MKEETTKNIVKELLKEYQLFNIIEGMEEYFDGIINSSEASESNNRISNGIHTLKRQLLY